MSVWSRSKSPKMEARTRRMMEEAEQNRRSENVKTMTDAGVYNDIVEELKRARNKHPVPFHSSHEGYAILLEEADDLWQEVKKQSNERSYAKMREEAIQIAAMAIRFAEDVCNPRIPPPRREETILQKRVTDGSSVGDTGKGESSS